MRPAALLAAIPLTVVTTLPAQRDQFSFVAGGDVAATSGRSIECGLRVQAGARAMGGYGWVDARLRNSDSAAHTVRLELRRAHDWSRLRFSAVKTLQLEPGERQRVVLPMLCCQETLRLSVSVDGNELERSEQPKFRGGAPRHGPVVLVLCESGDRVPDLKRPIEKAHVKKSSRVRLEFLARQPADLPDRWWLLSGFALVVVDGRARDWTPERQRLVARYVSSGGRVWVAHASSLPEGELRGLLDPAAGEGSGRHGFGNWITGDPDIPQRTIGPWLNDKIEGSLSPANWQWSGTSPHFAAGALEIPGLGDVPVVLFFLLIAGFAFVVGPVNFFWFQRKLRRPLMLLVTVPLAGISFTAVILVWGLFSEGFGITGSDWTVSVLDQRKHEVVVQSGRTLYAGLSPTALTPLPGSSIYSPSLTPRRRATVAALDIDLDKGGRIGGSILPSRTRTSVVATTVTPARARLRFRRLASGGLDILSAPELTPREARSSLLLRDFSGRFWVRTEGGRMQPVAVGQVDRKMRELRQLWAKQFRQVAWRNYSPYDWFDRKCDIESLPPGSYVAVVHDVPFFDELGLDVEWGRRSHLVVGRLAKEDIVE